MIERYANFCYEEIGSYVLDYLDYFEGLRPQLNRADIGVSLPEYISMMFFTSLVTTVAATIILVQIFVLSSGLPGIFLGISIGALLGGGVLVGFYLYPSIKIHDRASKIEDQLPFGVMYLSTLAGTGTSVPEIFHNLSEAEEYHELSKEAEKIHRDIELFGMDVSEALKQAAERSPSDNWEEVLWGMNHVLTTGGSLREFLNERASVLMEDYERRIEEFSNQLSILVEMYIILVIVGSIIFTSMSVIMSSFSSMNPNLIVLIQAVSAFIGLPFISLVFIIIVDGLTPEGIG